MIATAILLYFVLIYFFELQKETALKILLVYSLLNLLSVGILVLLFGIEGKMQLLISVLVGI